MKKLQNIFSLQKLSYEENAMFFESLSELTNTGVPIIKLLDISDIKLKNKAIINTIKQDIQKGQSLSYSLENTKSFSDIAISIINIGEESGNLKISFEKLSSYYYKLSETKKNIISSLFYPLILIISIFLLITFINFYFIPSVVSLYGYDITALNFFTRILFQTSLFLSSYKLSSNILIFSFIITICILIGELISKNSDSIVYNLPIISNLYKTQALYSILWAYFIMSSSDIDISKASRIIKNQTKNKAIYKKLALFEKNISSGKSLTKSIEELELKDEKLLYFISLGEQSGKLDKYLGILSDMYSKKLNQNIKYISAIIQPVLIIIITFVVGIIISGVVLPALNYGALI